MHILDGLVNSCATCRATPMPRNGIMPCPRRGLSSDGASPASWPATLYIPLQKGRRHIALRFFLPL